MIAFLGYFLICEEICWSVCSCFFATRVRQRTTECPTPALTTSAFISFLSYVINTLLYAPQTHQSQCST